MVIFGPTSFFNLSDGLERTKRRKGTRRWSRWRPAPPRPSRTVGGAEFPRASTSTSGKAAARLLTLRDLFWGLFGEAFPQIVDVLSYRMTCALPETAQQLLQSTRFAPAGDNSTGANYTLRSSYPKAIFLPSRCGFAAMSTTVIRAETSSIFGSAETRVSSCGRSTPGRPRFSTVLPASTFGFAWAGTRSRLPYTTRCRWSFVAVVTVQFPCPLTCS